MNTLFSMVITIVLYIGSRFLVRMYPSPYLNLVFISTVFIIMVLNGLNMSYQDYSMAKEIMTYLLGPATVALAVPIYKNRELFISYFHATIIGLLIGSVVTVGSALLMGSLFHFSKDFYLALTVKSITTPIAIEIGEIMGGNVELIVGFVIITGMLGAMFGAKFLSLVHVHHPFARGLSIGTIAHGIGTAEAVKEGEVQGAIAGAAMGITGLLTSIIIPVVFDLFH